MLCLHVEAGNTRTQCAVHQLGRAMGKDENMKALAKPVEVVEVEAEGFFALMGKRITMWCLDGFIYTGKLVGVNSTFIKLEDPSQVFETGPFTTKEWKDAQRLPNDLYIPSNAYGPFTVLK